MNKKVTLCSPKVVKIRKDLNVSKQSPLTIYQLPRERISDFDISGWITIPYELTAAAWCDGDFPQVNAIVSNHNLFTEMKVVANKQNAARTGVEQPADLFKVFITFKQQNKAYTIL